MFDAYLLGGGAQQAWSLGENSTTAEVTAAQYNWGRPIGCTNYSSPILYLILKTESENNV